MATVVLIPAVIPTGHFVKCKPQYKAVVLEARPLEDTRPLAQTVDWVEHDTFDGRIVRDSKNWTIDRVEAQLEAEARVEAIRYERMHAR